MVVYTCIRRCTPCPWTHRISWDKITAVSTSDNCCGYTKTITRHQITLRTTVTENRGHQTTSRGHIRRSKSVYPVRCCTNELKYSHMQKYGTTQKPSCRWNWSYIFRQRNIFLLYSVFKSFSWLWNTRLKKLPLAMKHTTWALVTFKHKKTGACMERKLCCAVAGLGELAGRVRVEVGLGLEVCCCGAGKIYQIPAGLGGFKFCRGGSGQ